MRLVFDTSSLNVSAGLFENGIWIHTIDRFEDKHQQSKLIFGILNDLFQEAGRPQGGLTEVAVGKGPGSYTGLRVGMTIAKTLAYAKNLHLFSFSSEKLLERTHRNEPDTIFPKVKYLETKDFEKLAKLGDLEPIYVNDHFV